VKQLPSLTHRGLFDGVAMPAGTAGIPTGTKRFRRDRFRTGHGPDAEPCSQFVGRKPPIAQAGFGGRRSEPFATGRVGAPLAVHLDREPRRAIKPAENGDTKSAQAGLRD
jgi:hypothetical protein